MESNNIFVPKEDRDRFFDENKNYVYVIYDVLNKSYHPITDFDHVNLYYNNDTMSHKIEYIHLELAFIFEFDQNFLAMNKIFSRNDPRYHKIVYHSFKNGDFMFIAVDTEDIQKYKFGVVIYKNKTGYVFYEDGGFDYLETVLDSEDYYKILVVDGEAYSFNNFKGNLNRYYTLRLLNKNSFSYIDPDFKTYYKNYLDQGEKV